MPTPRKLLNTLKIMEQKEAFRTQIDIAMLAYYLSLPYVLGGAHTSQISKVHLKHVLSETAKMTPATITSLYLFMKII
jgi:hypothetical protein